MDADFFVIIIVFLIYTINRHSLIFLCVFALSEIPHLLNTNPIYDNVFIASTFAITAFSASNIKPELQLALIYYSVLFWFSGFDYYAFPHETYFYVIFPYTIKLIDLYVIYHLIRKEEQRYNGNNTAFSYPFY